MFGIGQKTLLLVGWYVVWSLITSLYNDKKGKKVREELEEVKWDNKEAQKIIINNFIDTHKNLLESFKKNILTEENKTLLNQKFDKAKNEFENFVEDKKEDLKDLQKNTPNKINKIKKNIVSKFSEVKEKISK